MQPNNKCPNCKKLEYFVNAKSGTEMDDLYCSLTCQLTAEDKEEAEFDDKQVN